MLDPVKAPPLDLRLVLPNPTRSKALEPVETRRPRQNPVITINPAVNPRTIASYQTILRAHSRACIESSCGQLLRSAPPSASMETP